MDDEETPGGNPPEDIAERDRVGTTTPAAYPEEERDGSRVDQPGAETAR